MFTILFIVLGIVAILATQIDVVYYRYLLSKSDVSEAVRIKFIFNNTRRNILRYIFVIAGLGLLTLSGYCCLKEIPEHFPLVLTFIMAFILWTVLLQVSFKFFFRRLIKATTIALAFLLPLVLLGLLIISIYLFPELPAIIKSHQP